MAESNAERRPTSVQRLHDGAALGEFDGSQDAAFTRACATEMDICQAYW